MWKRYYNLMWCLKILSYIVGLCKMFVWYVKDLVVIEIIVFWIFKFDVYFLVNWLV